MSKLYKVTLREWMYQEKELLIRAESREEAVSYADDECVNPSDLNRNAEWTGYRFKPLKPKVTIKRGR